MTVQPKVRQLTPQLCTAIARLHNGQKTLATLQKRIDRLDEYLTPIMGSDFRTYLERALQPLKLAEEELIRREGVHSSTLSPSKRKSSFKTSRWQILITPFNYDLPTLRKKAPAQWFLNAMDAMLRERLGNARVAMSAMTRYRVISAILKSAGARAPSPQTIKEYFEEKKRKESGSSKKN